MDLRQLRYFVAVADLGSFTAAADDLDVVQSSVSHGIRKLEESLGVELFDRSGRRVRPSEAGQVLLPHATVAVHAADAAQAAIGELEDGLRGIVRMRTVDVRHLVDLAPFLASFYRRHPAVQIQVTQSGDSAQHLAAVRDGHADIAVVASPDSAPAGLEFTTLREDPLLLAVATTHPLAVRESVTLADAAHEVFAVASPGSPSKAILTQLFKEAGFDVDIAFEIDFVPDHMQLVAERVAVALAPSVVIDQAPGVQGVPFRDSARSNRIVLARASTRRLGAAVDAFSAELGHVIAGSSPSTGRGTRSDRLRSRRSRPHEQTLPNS